MSSWLDFVSVTWHVWVHLPGFFFVALTTRFKRLFPLTLCISLWEKKKQQTQTKNKRKLPEWPHSGNTETKHPLRKAISNEPSKQPAKKEINPFFLSLSIFVTLDIRFDHNRNQAERRIFKKLLKKWERILESSWLIPGEPGRAGPARAVSLIPPSPRWQNSGCFLAGTVWNGSFLLALSESLARNCISCGPYAGELQRSDSEM